MKIIIFHSNIIKIGGVETFTYNMIKQLSKYYDVEVLYNECDINQLLRISNYVPINKYDTDKEYKCDICITATSWGGWPTSVKAKEYWQMIHANYKELLKANYKYNQWERTTRHIAVSNTVRDIFNELYGKTLPATTVYNILDEIQPTKPILKLISATRLSGEKGYDRMVKLAKTLKEKNIKFRWIIFTNLEVYNIKLMDYEEIIYMKPRYDIWDYIKEADYGVQLSDTEGYSYFVNECLQYGTPMLVTNFDSVFESVEDGVNGYILNMDLSNLDLDKIVNKIPNKFKYTPKTTSDTWIKEIGTPSKKETYKRNTTIKVKAVKQYTDVKLDRVVRANEEIEMPIDRAIELIQKGLVK